MNGKQTYSDLAKSFGVSQSTIKRKLKFPEKEHIRCHIPCHVVLLMDTTYWGRNWGLLVIMDAHTKALLWKKYVKHERLADYKEGVDYLESLGYCIDGIVCDGLKGMFQLFSAYRIQMCQFHQVAIIRRYITICPKLEAGKELKAITKLLTRTDKESFVEEFDNWIVKWNKFLKERTLNPITGKSKYTHGRLRSAYLSIKRNLPFLFVWFDYPEFGIPNTNNSLEGSFTALKNKLRNHNGLSKENRMRFINEFFKA